VTLAGVELTGPMNFDCGKFEYGTLFEATALGDRLLPRRATVSYDDLLGPWRDKSARFRERSNVNPKA